MKKKYNIIKKNVDKEDIFKIVEDFYEIKHDELLKKNTRGYPYDLAKIVIIRLLNTYSRMKYSEIAKIFNVTYRAIVYRQKTSSPCMKKELKSNLNEITEIINKL